MHNRGNDYKQNGGKVDPRESDGPGKKYWKSHWIKSIGDFWKDDRTPKERHLDVLLTRHTHFLIMTKSWVVQARKKGSL